jgi:putative ABC transport system permease protein
MEDLPQNSDLRFPMLLSLHESAPSNDWFDIGYYTYVLIKEEATHPGMAQALEEKLMAVSREKVDPLLRKYDAGISFVFHVQAFQDLHFTSSMLADTPKGNMQYVYLFSAAAVLILVIACLNYINFAIAQSMTRSREVGIRKAIGASLRQLAAHYIGESFTVTFLAMLLAALIVLLALPAFNILTGKAFTMADTVQPAMLLAAAGILAIVSLFAGSYSAFYTAAIRPVNALRGKITSPGGQVIRKTSLVVQFAISTGLLVGAVAISRQMTFMQTFDPGFRKDHMLVLDTPQDSIAYPRVASLAETLRNSHGVTGISITGTGGVPGDNDGAMMYMTTKDKQGHLVRFAYVDEVYIPLLGLEVQVGRNFDVNRPADRQDAVMVNEAYVQMMGWKDPLQEKIEWGRGKRQVIGVIRNFHSRSLHNPIEPYLMALQEHHHASHVLVRLGDADPDDMVALARQHWKQLFADEPFVYRFLDETLAAQYHKEKIVTHVLTAFSIVAQAIAFFGLAGLTALSIYQRKKEIGIRKIIGARMSSLVWLFFREYGKLILIALVLTFPVTGYLVQTWLETFSRHVSPGLWVYILTGMGVVMLALATASAGIVRIARANPAGLIRE